MMDRRYLLYQPAHGMAVETHVLETVRRIAAALERVVVVPKLPVLETLEYERGLDEYLELPRTFSWISTDRFLREVGARIDALYRIVPLYRPEYTNQHVRQMHPTWVQVIEQAAYFARIGFAAAREMTCELSAALGDDDMVRRQFGSADRVIGITYCNGLMPKPPPLLGPHRANATPDEFAGHVSFPPLPAAEFMGQARRLMGGQRYTAVHWRRGANLIPMAEQVLNVRLPSLGEFYGHVPADCQQVYLASDVEDITFTVPDRPDLPVRRFRCASPNDNAATDLGICILAETFIGTEISTFSHYIVHARSLSGCPDASHVLL